MRRYQVWEQLRRSRLPYPYPPCLPANFSHIAAEHSSDSAPWAARPKQTLTNRVRYQIKSTTSRTGALGSVYSIAGPNERKHLHWRRYIQNHTNVPCAHKGTVRNTY
jgi:hypothetical protein